MQTKDTHVIDLLSNYCLREKVSTGSSKGKLTNQLAQVWDFNKSGTLNLLLMFVLHTRYTRIHIIKSVVLCVGSVVVFTMMLTVKGNGSSPEPPSSPKRNIVRRVTMDKASAMELRRNVFERSVKNGRNVTRPQEEFEEQNQESSARGGVVVPFPWKLHEMLERIEMDGFSSVVSWQPHGRSFMVHKPDEFVQRVMPIYFNQTKFASFQRQLNLYGFRRFTSGQDKGAYYHSMFLRGKRYLCTNMNRKKIKGTRVRKAMKPGSEPNFYEMPFMERAKSEKALPNIKRSTPVKPNNITSQQTNKSSQVAKTTNHPSHAIVGPPSTPPLSPENALPQPVTPDHCSSFSSGKPIVTVLNATSFRTGSDYTCGDVLFFEGKPFHYLDHGYGVTTVLQAPPFMLPKSMI